MTSEEESLVREWLEQLKPVFDGQQVRLKVSGSGSGYLPFLTGCSFAGLN